MTSQLTPLVIVGAGGHGRETLDVVEAINHQNHLWHFVGFIDDGPVVQDRLDRRDAGLVHRDEIDPAVVRYVVGIGDPMIRSHLAAEMDHAGFTAATLIHPAATVGSDNRLGAGVVLAAHATVTTNVTLGSHTQLNIGATVSHDCEVGHAVTISPGAYVNGSCHLDDHVVLGTGAIVTPGHYIGAETVVGAGAVVVDDIPVGITVTGVPARPVSGQHGRIDLETASRLIREDRDSR